MLNAYDEPFADSSAIPTMLVAKLARQEVKMTLSGDGGDELFHGYGFYNWANRLNHPLIQLLKTPIAAGLKLGNNRMKRASSLFTFPKNHLKTHIFSQEQYYFSEAELQNLLGEKYAALPSELNHEKALARNLLPAEQQSLFDINYYLKDDLLTKVDIATMKFGLENRVPLLDYRLVEFALNLSPDLKIKNGEQKYLLKQLLYQYVPKQLFDRPKQGFSIPLATWLKGDLNYLIHEHLNQKNIENYAWVKWSEVQKLVLRFNNGETYLYTRVWALIVLHHWLKNSDKNL
jgi:asparagine synthase (glutamine-hydrolysing)